MTRDERQALAIEKWKAVKCRGSWCFATGFGKTRTALNAIQRLLEKNPGMITVVIVPTKVLKDQWVEQLQARKLPVTVIVINSAIKNNFACDFLIIDECHRINSETFSSIFERCNPKAILGLTATYERLDEREKEILDKHAPVCDVVTVKEATENGWLSPYREYKVLLDVDLTEYDKANREFVQHFAFFNFEFSVAMGCVVSFWNQQVYAKKINCSVTEVKAHAFAWNRALRFRKTFIANHPKKLEIAKLILENRSDKKCITFNSSIKQCEAYKSGYVLHSGNTKKKNRMTLEEFSNETTGVLHSSKMADEGLDVKGLSVAIITGFNSSQSSKTQRIE